MKKKIIGLVGMILISSLVFSSTTNAQKKGLGAGIIIGTATGVNIKYWINPKNAWDATFAWDLDKNNFQFHFDYLWHDSTQFSEKNHILYYGIGSKFKSEKDENKFGLRGVIGLDYFYHKAPLDLFIEVSPGILLIPKTKFEVDFGLGIRYFF